MTSKASGPAPARARTRESPAAPASGTAGQTARAKRDYVRRAYALKVATVQRVCRRVEAGENLTEVCRDPDMPQRSTLVAWLAREPELQAMVEAARAAAVAVFAPRRTYHTWDEAVAAEVLARIEDGRGLREVCAEPDMPVHSTVTRWLKARPEFATAYRRAREAQADRLFDLAWRIACEATEDTVATARLKIQTLKWRVGRLAPRVYGPLKAQDPVAEGDGGKGPDRVVFEVRHFALTPDRKVVETTRAGRGMTKAQRDELFAAIGDGRITPEDLARMGEGED